MKKYIAPVVVTFLTLLYLGLLAFGASFLPHSTTAQIVIKVTVIAVALALGAALITVLIQRIREIKEEDKDDLGKY